MQCERQAPSPRLTCLGSHLPDLTNRVFVCQQIWHSECLSLSSGQEVEVSTTFLLGNNFLSQTHSRTTSITDLQLTAHLHPCQCLLWASQWLSCFMIASLLSESVNTVPPEVFCYRQSLKANIHELSKDASVKCSSVEVDPWMSLWCSQSKAGSCLIFHFPSSLPGAHVSLNFRYMV